MNKDEKLNFLRVQFGWLTDPCCLPKSSEDVAKFIQNILNQAFDSKLCGKSYKWMYFCTKPKRHKDFHSEHGRLKWEQGEADQDFTNRRKIKKKK